jgi:hypothetical protein
MGDEGWWLNPLDINSTSPSFQASVLRQPTPQTQQTFQSRTGTRPDMF